MPGPPASRCRGRRGRAGQCLAYQVLQLVRALQVCEKRPWHCRPQVAAAFSDWETSQLTSRKSSRTGPASIAMKLESEWGVGVEGVVVVVVLASTFYHLIHPAINPSFFASFQDAH